MYFSVIAKYVKGKDSRVIFSSFSSIFLVTLNTVRKHREVNEGAYIFPNHYQKVSERIEITMNEITHTFGGIVGDGVYVCDGDKVVLRGDASPQVNHVTYPI